jgi:hypothetical protein
MFLKMNLHWQSFDIVATDKDVNIGKSALLALAPWVERNK